MCGELKTIMNVVVAEKCTKSNKLLMHHKLQRFIIKLQDGCLMP